MSKIECGQLQSELFGRMHSTLQSHGLFALAKRLYNLQTADLALDRCAVDAGVYVRVFSVIIIAVCCLVCLVTVLITIAAVCYYKFSYRRSPLHVYCILLGRVALGAQRPIVTKLSRERSVGRSVCPSVQCIVEKRQIAAGSRSAP